jgi:sec-independent protein translocase protein TatA
MFDGIGLPELLVILAIVVVLFGAGKLPQVGKALGEAIHNFKKAQSGEADLEKGNDKKLATDEIKKVV